MARGIPAATTAYGDDSSSASSQGFRWLAIANDTGTFTRAAQQRIEQARQAREATEYGGARPPPAPHGALIQGGTSDTATNSPGRVALAGERHERGAARRVRSDQCTRAADTAAGANPTTAPRRPGPRAPRRQPHRPRWRIHQRPRRRPASRNAAAPSASAMVGDVARLDGQLVHAVDTTWMPFDRLTAYDAELKPQPMLAESWELSSDSKQIKLNLRKGVQFHSGRELTSDDVKCNILCVRDPKVAAGALVQQSKWFTDDRDARQVHRHPEVRAAAAGGLRLLRVLQHRRPGHREGPDATRSWSAPGRSR